MRISFIQVLLLVLLFSSPVMSRQKDLQKRDSAGIEAPKKIEYSSLSALDTSSSLDSLYSSFNSHSQARTDPQQSASSPWDLVVPIIVALLAGIIALIQVRANIISSARIRWVENLRLTTGELIAQVEMFNLSLREMKVLDGKGNRSASLEVHARIFKEMGPARALFYKAKLYLSATDPNHKKLDATLDKLLHISLSDYERLDDAKAIAALTDEVVALAQAVLKEGWQDSKSINLRDAFRFSWH